MSRPRATVIGAGPAGLSAGLGLSRAGYDAHLYEQRLRWTGRVCGCFLSPESVRHLAWLGVLDDVRRVAVSVTETTLTWKALRVRVPVGDGSRGGLALSRQALEEILLAHAQRNGVTVHAGPEQSTGEALRVLAAGRFATVDKTVQPKRAWYGWNASFSGVRQRPGEMAMHFYSGGYVGVVTFADGQTNVCGLSLNPDRSGGWSGVFEAALRASEAFADQMQSATLASEWRGVGPLPFCSTMRSAPGVVCVGDAAAVGDPLMGEGNSRALAAGPMLFQALVNGAPIAQSYPALWSQAFTSRLKAGGVVRWVLEHPGLANRLVPLMLGHPSFSRRLGRLFHRGYFL